MSELHDSDLYSAAVNALASDASASNTFEKIMLSATSVLDVSSFKQELAVIEDIIRSEYSLTSMPGPWRSAKSVVLGALSLGITLLDGNGLTRGKSELQAAIKTAKGELTEPPTPHDRAMVYVGSLAKMWKDLSIEQSNTIKAIIAGW